MAPWVLWLNLFVLFGVVDFFDVVEEVRAVFSARNSVSRIWICKDTNVAFCLGCFGLVLEACCLFSRPEINYLVCLLLR